MPRNALRTHIPPRSPAKRSVGKKQFADSEKIIEIRFGGADLQPSERRLAEVHADIAFFVDEHPLGILHLRYGLFGAIGIGGDGLQRRKQDKCQAGQFHFIFSLYAALTVSAVFSSTKVPSVPIPITVAPG